MNYVQRDLGKVIGSLMMTYPDTPSRQEAIDLILELAAQEILLRDRYAEAKEFAQVDACSQQGGVNWYVVRREGGGDAWQHFGDEVFLVYSAALAKTRQLSDDPHYYYAVLTARRVKEIQAAAQSQS